MCISISKRGNSLLEVSIAMALLSILILGCAGLEGTRIKLKAYNKKKENYILCMEAMKVSIMNNITYERIIELSSLGKRYINASDISMEIISRDEMVNLFCKEVNMEKSFIEISIAPIDSMKCLNVILKCHIFEGKVNEVIECAFYKGNYH